MCQSEQLLWELASDPTIADSKFMLGVPDLTVINRNKDSAPCYNCCKQKLLLFLSTTTDFLTGVLCRTWRNCPPHLIKKCYKCLISIRSFDKGCFNKFLLVTSDVLLNLTFHWWSCSNWFTRNEGSVVFSYATVKRSIFLMGKTRAVIVSTLIENRKSELDTCIRAEYLDVTIALQSLNASLIRSALV